MLSWKRSDVHRKRSGKTAKPGFVLAAATMLALAGWTLGGGAAMADPGWGHHRGDHGPDRGGPGWGPPAHQPWPRPQYFRPPPPRIIYVPPYYPTSPYYPRAGYYAPPPMVAPPYYAPPVVVAPPAGFSIVVPIR